MLARWMAWLATALMIAAAVARLWMLPLPSWPAAAALPTDAPQQNAAQQNAASHIAGSLHIHSDLSHDSDVSLDAIALAAKDAGLDFVIVTDHNRQHAAPLFREGVLFIFGTERSAPFGHGLEIHQAPSSPLPPTNDAANWQASVTKHLGLAAAAHPSDPKRPWGASLDLVPALEIANAATAFRHLAGMAYFGWATLAPAALIRPNLALLQLYHPDRAALKLWDRAPNNKVGLCAVDAHGLIPLKENLAVWRTHIPQLALPKWQATAAQKTDAAASDAAKMVMDALKAGRFACFAGNLKQAPPKFWLRNQPAKALGLAESESRSDSDFKAKAKAKAKARAKATQDLSQHAALPHAGLPQDLILGRSGKVRPDVHLVLLRQGQVVARTIQTRLQYPHALPGRYRAEIRMQLPNPWWGTYSATVAYSQAIQIPELAAIQRDGQTPSQTAPTKPKAPTP